MSCQSEDRLTGEFRTNSLAERVLTSKYNPIKTQQVFEEFVSLLNSDPDFKKKFYINGPNGLPEVGIRLQSQGFRIDFSDVDRKQAYDRFLSGGGRTFKLLKDDYKRFYIIDDGMELDSFSNADVNLIRDFPILPPVIVSTVNPTGEYLCTSMLDIQIDSVMDNTLYLSNSSQNSTFKVRLTYDVEKATFALDQLSDIFFDAESSLFSVDQEISYYRFMIALLKNARVKVRHAITGDVIYESGPFLPHNLDTGRSYESFQMRLAILSSLTWIQDHWGLQFSRSNISETEYALIKAIGESGRSCSRLTNYPVIFTLNKQVSENLERKKGTLENAGGEIISDDYHISILGQELNLGRLAISVPPSNIESSLAGESVRYTIRPIDPKSPVRLEFADLKSSVPPDVVFHSNSAIRSSEPTVCYLNGLRIDETCWGKLSECK